MRHAVTTQHYNFNSREDLLVIFFPLSEKEHKEKWVPAGSRVYCQGQLIGIVLEEHWVARERKDHFLEGVWAYAYIPRRSLAAAQKLLELGRHDRLHFARINDAESLLLVPAAEVAAWGLVPSPLLYHLVERSFTYEELKRLYDTYGWHTTPPQNPQPDPWENDLYNFDDYDLENEWEV